MSAAAVFWRAVLTQGVFFGTVIGVYAYTGHGRIGGALVTGLCGLVLMGSLNGWWAVRDRRALSRRLGGIFERRSPAEIRGALRDPDCADPGLRAELRRLLGAQLGDEDRPVWPATTVIALLAAGTVIAAVLDSAAWLLVTVAAAVLFGDALLRRGRLRLALQRLEQVDGRPV